MTTATIDRDARLDIRDLDLEHAFSERPLDPQTLRCLRYMHDVESHTVCYLRDVLVTRTHREPEITEFLTRWNYEEHWHGEAIGRVLAAHGEQAGSPRIAGVREERAGRDRLRPLAFLVTSALVRDITAIHMTWGAVNEMTTHAGYARLATRADHPVLSDVLRRIMRQEGGHIAFYLSQARARLASSASARRVTRLALRRFWAPVGTGVRPAEETAFVVRWLFGDGAGQQAAARIDRGIDRLPGLASLGLIAGARDRAMSSRQSDRRQG